MKNWRTAPVEELIGQIVPTDTTYGNVRFGPFGMEFYNAVLADLVAWPPGLLENHPGWKIIEIDAPPPNLGHPLTMGLLIEAAAILADFGHAGIIRTNGYYRPIGSTWGNDPRGVIDSTDSIGLYHKAVDAGMAPHDARLKWGLGHYRGIAIDIAAGKTAANFGVTREKVVDVLLAVGFERPFLKAGAPKYTSNFKAYGEYWHFRPNAEKRKQWATRYLDALSL